MTARLLPAMAAFALAACAPQQDAGCAVEVSQEIAFTHAGANDVVTARSVGDTCINAVGLITITTADGAPIWAWAAPLARHFGDDFIEPEPEAMRAFLERWTQADVRTTQAAPEWAQLTAGQTTLDRLTYDDIRARNLPMLCHYSGTARHICVFWEPAAGGAGLFYERDDPHGEIEE